MRMSAASKSASAPISWCGSRLHRRAAVSIFRWKERLSAAGIRFELCSSMAHLCCEMETLSDATNRRFVRLRTPRHARLLRASASSLELVLSMPIHSDLEHLAAEAIAWRHHLHRHPELLFELR